MTMIRRGAGVTAAIEKSTFQVYFLKSSRLSIDRRMSRGKEFQRRGPKVEKPRWP